MKARKSWAMAYCGMAAALSVALMLLGAVVPVLILKSASVLPRRARTRSPTP